MTDGMSYGIRRSRTMDADAFFVQRNPENANRASRTGRQHVEMATPLPVLQHFFVPAKPRPFGHSLDFPISNGGSRLCRSYCDRISCDQFIAFEYAEHIRFRVDLHRQW